MQSSARDLDTTTLMGHEQSPIPTSMFDENGNMRDAKTKSNIKNALKVEVSRRLARWVRCPLGGDLANIWHCTRLPCPVPQLPILSEK